MVQPLQGSIRMYPWGSRTALAQMSGRPVPSEHPEAEMWFGAHPGAPATVDGEPLDVLISSDSTAALGSEVDDRYKGKLPFLLKLLAADAPLSLQAHPTKEQAEAGFAREDTLGIDRDALDRNYKDDNHKPELIVALTDFVAMCGFRDVADTLRLFSALDVAALGRYSAMISGVSPAEGLRSLLTTWITLPSDPRRDLIEAVVDGARRYGEDSPSGEFSLVARTIVALADRYPGDPGVLCALLLNHIELKPGEGIFLDAGQLHAYVQGFGVEIMANSDNVLRGGLTSKHIDVPELVRVLTFAPLDDPVIRPVALSPSDSSSEVEGFYYPTPAPEFRLQRWQIAPGGHVVVPDSAAADAQIGLSHGPAIVLSTQGHVVLSSADEDGFGDLELNPSEASWIPGESEGVTITNKSDEEAQVFVALVGSV